MKRKLLLGLGSGALLLTGVALLTPEPSGNTVPSRAQETSGSFEVGIPTAQEIRNMLAVYGQRVETTEQEIAQLKEQLKTTEENLTAARQRDSSTLESLIDEIRSSTRTVETPPDPTGPRFRTYEFTSINTRSLHIPAGSFGEATLLSGVFAPTTGDPLPVLLRLDAALVGPQRTRIPLRGAFLVGKAQGDANARRATVQIETLSAVQPDGTSFDVPVNGWVVDEDGIQGLRGEYVWHADEILGLAAVSGALSGGAQALAERETLVQATPLGGLQEMVTGNPLRFAGARAASAAFDRLEEAVSKRLDEIVPAIHVANSRRVTVAFISGVTLEGWDPASDVGSPFKGLDQ